MSPNDDPLIALVFLLKGRSKERGDMMWATYLVTMDRAEIDHVEKSLKECGMETMVATHFLRVPQCIACGEHLFCGQGHDCPEGRFFGPSDAAENPDWAETLDGIRAQTQAELEAHADAAVDAAIAKAYGDTDTQDRTTVRRRRR